MIYLHVHQLTDEAKGHSKKILNSHLSHYLDKKPSDIKMDYNENGKPFVNGLSFSVSHSKHLLVLAFVNKGVIGVDVERVNSKKSYLAIAKRYFHEKEYKYLQKLQERDVTLATNVFFQLWTAKEALCKAQGGRLWYYLNENYLTQTNKITAKFKGLNITHINEIDNFSLCLAYESATQNVNIIYA
jgi:4'-phosphopantetheinyl transferase